jgi:hypothetical protein
MPEELILRQAVETAWSVYLARIQTVIPALPWPSRPPELVSTIGRQRAATPVSTGSLVFAAKRRNSSNLELPATLLCERPSV